MIKLENISAGQELLVRLEVVECHPSGVSFKMPSGVHVYLNVADFDKLSPVPAAPQET